MSNERQVLIVEDENSVARFLYQALSEAGYEPTACGNGKVACELAKAQPYDLILLDLNLPGRDGLEVCRDLRSSGLDTPVLMLTARDATEDKIAGLDSGADDYIVKPFELGELLARVRALLRRAASPLPSESGPADELRLDDVLLDRRTRIVERKGRRLSLSSTEFALLEVLLRSAGEAVSREQLLKDVWDFDFGGSANVLHVYINYLRNKLEEGGARRLIHTVRGVGYRAAIKP